MTIGNFAHFFNALYPPGRRENTGRKPSPRGHKLKSIQIVGMHALGPESHDRLQACEGVGYVDMLLEITLYVQAVGFLYLDRIGGAAVKNKGDGFKPELRRGVDDPFELQAVHRIPAGSPVQGASWQPVSAHARGAGRQRIKIFLGGSSYSHMNALMH